jgi:hypothetical protein
VGDKGNLRFRFTQSPSGVISGIALEKDGDIVASFKLEVGRGIVYMHGKPWSSVILTMVCRAQGAKVYDAFDMILSKYGERDARFQTGGIGRIRCCWMIHNDKVKSAVEEIGKTLEKPKNNTV